MRNTEGMFYVGSKSQPMTVAREKRECSWRRRRLLWRARDIGIPGQPESTTYIGEFVERVVTGTAEAWRHYIYSPLGWLGVYIRRSDGTNAMYSFTLDHLGSIDSISNASGSIEVRLSYDAHGKRRNEAGWSGSVPDADYLKINAISRAAVSRGTRCSII
jgi:hypothetical protein